MLVDLIDHCEEVVAFVPLDLIDTNSTDIIQIRMLTAPLDGHLD